MLSLPPLSRRSSMAMAQRCIPNPAIASVEYPHVLEDVRFEPCRRDNDYCGMEQMVARESHNLEVGCSSPSPATSSLLEDNVYNSQIAERGGLDWPPLCHSPMISNIFSSFGSEIGCRPRRNPFNSCGVMPICAARVRCDILICLSRASMRLLISTLFIGNLLVQNGYITFINRHYN